MPPFSTIQDVWDKLMIWMSLPPPGQVYSPPNPDAFVHPSSLNHITPLEAVSRLPSQSSERCFTQSLPLVPASFHLFTNSWAGTRSFPSLFGWEGSFSRSCSRVTSALRVIFVLGRAAVKYSATHEGSPHE